MKKCPNCNKEFPDSMRFCQTDGTPLVEVVEQIIQPEDPLKTTVVRQEDIASSIPAADPFKTMVASSVEKEDSGDLLQLPEELDPMKTMVATPIIEPEKPILEDVQPEPSPRFDSIKEEIQAETPPPATSSPFSDFSAPNELQSRSESQKDSPFSQPEPPKFNEPDLSPPSFGDLSAKDDAPADDIPATVFQNPWNEANQPKQDESPFSGGSPFSKQDDAPIPSPFDKPKSTFDPAPPVNNEPMFGGGQQQSPFNEPQSPFGQSPQSPFEAPKSSFDAPQSPFDAPQKSSFDAPQSPFDSPQQQQQQSSFEPPKPMFQDPPKPGFQDPPVQFGSPQSPFNPVQEQSYNQPLQQNEWTPPPSPVSGWQDQGLGAETPFQPPRVMQGQNQTLAIASIICGGISLVMLIGLIIPLVNFFCGVLIFGLGIAGIVTGFLARSRASANPDQYGGAGLALGGIITGGLSILAVLGWVALIILYIGAVLS